MTSFIGYADPSRQNKPEQVTAIVPGARCAFGEWDEMFGSNSDKASIAALIL